MRRRFRSLGRAAFTLLFLESTVLAYTPGKFYFQGHTKEKIIALTFDDGPGRFTPAVLDVLQKHHSHATFFLEGDQVEGYSATPAKILEAGDEIGNHTYTHFDFHQKKNATAERLVHELEQTEASISRSLHDPSFRTKVVRMPYGYFNHSWLLPTLKARGYALVHWSFGEDWHLNLPADKMIQDYVAHAGPGAVFLFHDGGRKREKTLQVLTAVMDLLEKKGYRFVSARELFETPLPIPVAAPVGTSTSTQP